MNIHAFVLIIPFRRNSLRERLRKSWKFGVFLAMTSGVLFTGNNCLIQYFKVNPLELLLVRSTFQVDIFQYHLILFIFTKTKSYEEIVLILIPFFLFQGNYLGLLNKNITTLKIIS